jgi:predicted MFS family arabinose efflux permease
VIDRVKRSTGRALAQYGILFTAKGAKKLMVFSALARLGAAMIGVSVIAMIAFRGRGFEVSGAVTFAGLISLAICGPIIGRQIDRGNPRTVILTASIFAAACLTALTALTYAGAPMWAMMLVYVGFGVQPQVGGIVRAQWVRLLSNDHSAVRTANAYEQIVEESCYLAGPALAGLLSALVFPEAGTLLAALLFLIGAVGVAALVTTGNESSESGNDAGPHRHGAESDTTQWKELILLAVAAGSLGGVFGSYDIVAIAYGDSLDQRGLGGVLIGIFAAGSLCGGLVSGAIKTTRHPSYQMLICMAGLSASLVLATLSGLIAAQVIFAFTAGCFVAPGLAAGMTWCQMIVKEDRLVQGMSVVTTGILFFVSIGSWAGGIAADNLAFPLPFVTSAFFAILGTILTTAIGHRSIRTRVGESQEENDVSNIQPK